MEQIIITPIIDAVGEIDEVAKNNIRTILSYKKSIVEPILDIGGGKKIEGDNKFLIVDEDTSLKALKDERTRLIAQKADIDDRIGKLDALIPLVNDKLDEEIAKIP